MAAIDRTKLPAYRLHYLGSDISQVTLVMMLFQIPNLLFIYSDYVLYGMSRQFFLLLMMRGFVLLISLIFCWVLNRQATVNLYSWLVFTWGLLIGGYVLFVNSSRPAGYMLYTLVDLALLVCYYLLLPNGFFLRILPPIVFTLGSLGLLFTHKIPGQLELNALLVFYIVVNILFFLASRQLYRFRWRQFQYLLDQEALTSQLNRLATTDELTGICNRREIFRLGDRELERFQRYNRVFTVMMIDIDHFKRINDTYGHRVGDEMLVSFTEHIKKSIRVEDMFGRFGGEEFVLILPETRMEGASGFIDRLGIGRTTIKSSIGEHILECTVSIGITESLTSDVSFEDILYRADEGLYKAKEEGRNRVVLVYGDLI
ncbi:MAG: GGDEF domain-containing protein [Methylocystaceae bacterium]